MATLPWVVIIAMAGWTIPSAPAVWLPPTLVDSLRMFSILTVSLTSLFSPTAK